MCWTSSTSRTGNRRLEPGFHPNATQATHATQAIAFRWKPGFTYDNVLIKHNLLLHLHQTSLHGRTEWSGTAWNNVLLPPDFWRSVTLASFSWTRPRGRRSNTRLQQITSDYRLSAKSLSVGLRLPKTGPGLCSFFDNALLLIMFRRPFGFMWSAALFQ